VQLTPTSNCAGSRAILGEIKVWEGCSPRVRIPGRLENGGGAVEPWVDGGGTPAAQNCSGEHGPDETEREGKPKGVPRS
jgi:hypothetical protein